MKKKALEMLVDLRKAKGLSQQKVAQFFELKNYNTVSQWESGLAQPPHTRRMKFIGYLWYELGLQQDEQQFLALWREIMEAMWEWEPLSVEEQAHIGLRTAAPPRTPTPLWGVPDKLPYPVLGRDQLVQELKTCLCTPNRVALFGVPGVGKTALALTLAYDTHMHTYFRDGIIWVTLGQRADVLAELNRVGALLGVTARLLADPQDVHAWVHAIAAATATRSLLFILDDAWDSDQAAAFRFNGADCAYLVTTRNPELAVQFAGEQVFAIQELSERDGLALLTRIAPTVVKRATPFARTVVTAVGALPLALVLVGNYLRVQALRTPTGAVPESVFQRLYQASELLKVEEPQAPIAKHPSLPKGARLSVQALIAVSDEALTPEAKALLRILSVFPAKPNTFSRAAAQAVSLQDVANLQQLAAYGLLEEVGQERYTVHMLIHEYAALAQQYPFITDRLIAYFATFTQAHKTEFTLLEQEHQNILTALESASQLGMQSALLTVASALSEYLELRGFYSLATVHLQRALQAAKALNSRSGELTILNALGRIERHLGHYLVAEGYFQTGLALAQASGETTYLCDLYRNLGAVAYFRGDYVQAERSWKTGLALAIEREDTNNLSGFYTNLGALAYNRNQFQEAEAYQQQALALAKATDNVERITGILQNLANIAKRIDDYAKAEAYCSEGLTLARQAKLSERTCQMLLGLGGTYVQRGMLTQALRVVQEGRSIAQELQHQEALCNALQFLGFIAGRQDDVTHALAYYQDALVVASGIGHPEHQGMTLYLLSGLEVEIGRYDEAAAHIAAGLKVANQQDFPFIWVNLQTILGKLSLAKAEREQAHAIYQQAYDVAQQSGYIQLEALALYGLAQVAHATGDNQQACQRGHAALAIFQGINHFLQAECANWLHTINCPP